MNIKKSLASALVAAGFAGMVSVPGHAAIISINFDVAQAGYTPAAPSVYQEIKDQFDSLGVKFRDNKAAPGSGAAGGDCTGGVGSDPVHLYGYGDGSSNCSDTLPDIDILFVDPSNPGNASYTTFFSILVTDDPFATLTAFDSLGNVLATAMASTGFNDTVTFSGVGNISRVHVVTFDPTALDDLQFEQVAAAVSEPASLGLLGLGLAGLWFGRRRKA